MRDAQKVMARNRKSGNTRAKAAAVALASAPLIVLPAAMGVTTAPQAAALELLPPEPARVLTLSFLPDGNNDDLGGVLCESPRTCVSVPYPYLLRSAGVIDLNNKLLDGTTGKQIVFGYSQGARVASDWLAEYAGKEGSLTPDEVSFVLIGNPSRKYGGADIGWGRVTPDTDYTVLDVSRQYDMASDYPDRFNLLAIANAYAGFAFIHQNYEEVDLYDPANYVWTEGKTTYVFIPTQNLPLLQPLRWIGLKALADSLNGPLKAIIESAYDRSYLPAEPGLPPAEPELEPDPEPEPEPEQPPADPDPEPEQPPAEDALMASRTAVDEVHAVAPVGTDTDVQPQDESDSEQIDDIDDLDDDGATGSGRDDGDEGDIDPDTDTDSEQDESESDGDGGPASSQENDTQQKSSASSDGDDAPKRTERSDSGE